MFNRDHYGLTSDITNSHATGSVAPTRPTLMKQQFLDEKRTRLEAEAAERRRQKINSFKQRVAVTYARLMKAAFKAFKAAKLSLSIVTRKA